jgi:hypothetical protein
MVVMNPTTSIRAPERRAVHVGRTRFAVAFAALTAVCGSVFGVVFSETLDVHAAAAEVATAVFVAGIGIAVVPVTQLLLPAASEEPGRVFGARDVLPLAVALLSAAAAVIHFAAIDQQSAGYWLFYLLFALLAVFQLAWAMLLFVSPSRLLYVLGALVNAGTVAVWAVSRTSGIPFGPTAGEAESIAFGDVTATVFEVLLVVGVIALLVIRTLRPARGPVAATASFLLTQLLLAPTALALISSVGTHLLVPPSD